MDQLDDKNYQTFWRLSKLYDIPEFVKDAEVPAETLHHTVFADEAGKKFPCNSPAETYISYLYFLDGANSVQMTKRAFLRDRIRWFGKFWNIEEHLFDLDRQFEKAGKAPDIGDEDYALVVQHGEKKIRKFPIRNSETVKVAAQYLWDNRGAYPYDWRRLAARGILKKAAQFGVELDPKIEIYLERASGNGVAPAEKVATHLYYRACMLSSVPGSEKTRGQLAEVAKAVFGGSDPVPSDDLTKLAYIIDAIDIENGWNRLYATGLSSPEEICFGYSVKLAEAIKAAHIKLMTGSVYRAADLSNVTKNVLDAAFPPDVVDALCDDGKPDISKMAAILPTLPLGDAAVFEKALHGADVHPAVLDSGADPDSYMSLM